MAWQRWRSNLALIASSIRRHWKNSSFSIIPAAALGSAWPWIGKRQIYRAANQPEAKACQPLNEDNGNDVATSRARPYLAALNTDTAVPAHLSDSKACRDGQEI